MLKKIKNLKKKNFYKVIIFNRLNQSICIIIIFSEKKIKILNKIKNNIDIKYNKNIL